jgi:hypothetical protein
LRNPNGEQSIDYGLGQSMLTTIDLPVISHVTRATAREPFLGLMLTLDVRSIHRCASSRRDGGASISEAICGELTNESIEFPPRNGTLPVSTICGPCLYGST